MSIHYSAILCMPMNQTKNTLICLYNKPNIMLKHDTRMPKKM